MIFFLLIDLSWISAAFTFSFLFHFRTHIRQCVREYSVASLAEIWQVRKKNGECYVITRKKFYKKKWGTRCVRHSVCIWKLERGVYLGKKLGEEGGGVYLSLARCVAQIARGRGVYVLLRHRPCGKKIRGVPCVRCVPHSGSVWIK